MVYQGNQKLGDLFISRREKGKPGLPTLSVTLTDGLVNRETLERKTDTNLAESEHLLVKEGDIAYNMMRMWQGASGRAEKDGLVSPAYIVLAPTRNVDTLFASYLFKTQRLIYLFWAYSYGLTSDRLRLYFNDFSRIPVDVPRIEEQRKIAQILSTWDKAIETTEKLIENSKAQKKALMQQLLTGKKRFLRFKGGWLDARLGDFLAKIIGGGTPDRSNPQYWEGDIPWVTVKDLISPIINGAKEHITKNGLSNSASNLIPAESVIVSTRMAVGKTVTNIVDVAINQDLKALVPKKMLLSKYLFFWMHNQTNTLDRLGTGSTVKGIQLSDIKSLRVSIPKILDEQRKILHALTVASRHSSLLEAKVENLRFEKRALMQQLLTGKRRVKVESEEQAHA